MRRARGGGVWRQESAMPLVWSSRLLPSNDSSPGRAQVLHRAALPHPPRAALAPSASTPARPSTIQKVYGELTKPDESDMDAAEVVAGERDWAEVSRRRKVATTGLGRSRV